MHGDTASILLDLLYASKAEAPARYRDIHQWRYDQELTRAKALIGTAVSAAIALLLSELKDELHASWTIVGAGLGGCLLLALVGLGFYIRAIRLPRDYATVLRLLKWMEGLV